MSPQRCPNSRSQTLAVFLVPSCLAVAVLLVQYLILHTPLSQAASWDVNPVDVVVLQWVRGVLRLLGLSFHHLDQPSRDNSLRAVFDQVCSPTPLLYRLGYSIES